MLNEDIVDSIDWLVSKVGKKDSQSYLKEIITTVCKLKDSDLNGGDWKLISRSNKELRQSFNGFKPYQDKRKVAIFGSARTPSDNPLYLMTEKFSKRIAEEDFMVITGAGGGIMEAGNKGAGDDSFGVNIRLPFEQSANEFIKGSPRLISYNYFFIRKLIFIKESDATVLFPGGFGTLDEAYEGLTLLQTGKSLPRPIVLMQEKGDDYWNKWVSFFSDVMLRDKYISDDDLDLVTICETIEEAVESITSFYRVYHSLRYVKDDAVLRLNKPITDDQINELNRDYSDIITEGEIVSSDPFPEEVISKDQLKKFRISFKFNRMNYGRLCTMIRQINTF